MIKFDSTITLGTILQVTVMLATFLKLYGDFREIKLKVDSMWHVFMKAHNESEE